MIHKTTPVLYMQWCPDCKALSVWSNYVYCGPEWYNIPDGSPVGIGDDKDD